FFSSRRRHTRFDCDWSSDVCSSDLTLRRKLDGLVAAALRILEDFSFVIANHDFFVVMIEHVTGIDRHFAAAAGSIDHVLRNGVRSEERRVGKECGSRWWGYDEKKE